MHGGGAGRGPREASRWGGGRAGPGLACARKHSQRSATGMHRPREVSISRKRRAPSSGRPSSGGPLAARSARVAPKGRGSAGVRMGGLGLFSWACRVPRAAVPTPRTPPVHEARMREFGGPTREESCFEGEMERGALELLDPRTLAT